MGSSVRERVFMRISCFRVAPIDSAGAPAALVPTAPMGRGRPRLPAHGGEGLGGAGWAVKSCLSRSGHLALAWSGTVVRTGRRRRYPVGARGAHQSATRLRLTRPPAYSAVPLSSAIAHGRVGLAQRALSVRSAAEERVQWFV